MTLLIAAPSADAANKTYSFDRYEVVVGEVEPLRRQIARCWNVSAVGKRDDFEVHIRVQFRPDGTVLTARVVDYAWIAGDPYRLSVAKSARHAILSRRCNPLLISRERRRPDQRITLTLNPRAIFRR